MADGRHIGNRKGAISPNAYEGETQAWRKVMAGYRRRRGLAACTPGSAPGATFANEYGRTLPFAFLQTLFLFYCNFAEDVAAEQSVLQQRSAYVRFANRLVVVSNVANGTQHHKQ